MQTCGRDSWAALSCGQQRQQTHDTVFLMALQLLLLLLMIMLLLLLLLLLLLMMMMMMLLLLLLVVRMLLLVAVFMTQPEAFVMLRMLQEPALHVALSKPPPINDRCL